MAMFDSFALGHAELKRAFDAAAQKGDGVMLVLGYVDVPRNDDGSILFFQSTDSCENVEAVPAAVDARRREKAGVYNVSLLAAYLTARPFAAQAAMAHDKSLAVNLPADVRQRLAAQQAQRDHEQAVAAWHRQPWVERMYFAAYPQPPKPRP
jgi:hypothetical protein